MLSGARFIGTGAGPIPLPPWARRMLAVVVLCIPALFTGCGGGPTWPGNAPPGRLASLTEYPFGGLGNRHRGTFYYDRAGQVIRFEFARIEVGEDGPVEVTTHKALYSTRNGRLLGGEIHVRNQDEFLRYREWTYHHGPTGRLDSIRVTTLLALDFSPIRETSTERYAHDALGRISEVFRADGGHWRFAYDAAGNLIREELTTAEGLGLVFEHAFDDKLNPWSGMPWPGLLTVVAPWALTLSPHNIIRTDTRVVGGEGIVSTREVHINSYTPEGLPVQWIQRLINTARPDEVTAFVAEFEYGGR